MLRKDGPWLCIPIYIWLDLLTISTLVNTKQRDYCNIFSRISTVGILTPLGQGCHFCRWTLLAACLPSSCPAIAPWGCQFVANFAADLIGSWSLYFAVTNQMIWSIMIDSFESSFAIQKMLDEPNDIVLGLGISNKTVVVEVTRRCDSVSFC